MSGKMVRNPGASEPAAVIFLAVMGLLVSLAIGAAAVLWRSHLLSPHTNWLRVPGALWQARHFPIVWQPFTVGFGLSLVVCAGLVLASMFQSQKLHGDARWARVGEIRKGNMLAKSGIVLGKKGGNVMRFGGNEHVMLEAPTRAGKGVGVIIPNLLEWEGSTVVLDVKQENWQNTAGFRATRLKQKVVLFNPLDMNGHTTRYNPLGYIDRRDEVVVINELQKIAAMLFPLPLQGEPFWAESARSAFLGVAAYIAATADDGDDALPFTMGEVYRQFAAGDAKKRFPRIIWKRQKDGKPLSEGCVSALRDWISASDNTFSSITKSVTAKINMWLNPIVDAATSESDFDLRDFRDQKISLYLGVSPDDLERAAPIYGLLFQQLIDHNVRELPNGDKHQVPLLVVLDEFASLGKCSVLAMAFSYVAGYGIRLLPAFQSLEQIEGVYGDKVAADIRRNCAVRLVLRPADLDDAKKISDRLGTYTFRARSRSMGGRSGGSVSDSDQRRPLMLPQEVELLPENDLIVFRRGAFPTYAKKIRYYAIRKLAELTRIPAPAMPVVRPDPRIARNSLRVIQAAEAEVGADAGSSSAAPPKGPLYNSAAVAAAVAAPGERKVQALFESVTLIGKRAA